MESLKSRRRPAVLTLLQTFLWYRQRLFVNQLKLASRGDAASQLARILGLLQPLFVFGVFVPGLITSAVGSLWAGRWWAFQSSPPSAPLPILSAALFISLLAGCGYPLLTLSQGAVAPASRMLLLPVPRRQLHGLEFTSNLMNPIVGSIAVILLAGSCGVMLGGRIRLGLVALAAAVCFVTLLLGLQSCVGLLLQWLFRDRRRGQYFGILLVFTLASVGFIPALAENAQSTSRQIFNSLHRIDFLLPSSQPSEVLTWGLIADWQRVSFYLLVLAGEALLLYLASSGIHRYLQTTTGGSTLRRKRVSAQPRSISWLDPRVAAVAQIQIRQGIRSARGKLGLLFSPFIIPMAGVVLLTREESGSFLRGLPIASGLMLALGAIAFGLLAFQPFACNLLGSDERGLTRLLLMPLDPSRLARGKMLGISALLGMAMLLGFLGTLLVAPVGSPLDWLAVLLVGATAILVFGPFGLLLSVLLPKLALTDSWGEKGNPHPLAGLAGTLIVVPLVGIPGLTLLLMAASSHRLLWFGCGLLLWCGVCWLISRFLSHWATHLLATRREFLYNISEGR